METQDITFKIKHTESMTENEKYIVDSMNQNTNALITTFNAIIQKQSELLLGHIKNELNGVKNDVADLKTSIDQQSSDIREILKRIENK